MLNRLPKPGQMPSLAMMFEDIGNPTPKQVGDALGVHEATVCRWLRKGQAPRSAMLALFWITRWGVSQVHAEAHNAAVVHAGHARALLTQVHKLESRLARLARIADFGAGNDPIQDAGRLGRSLPLVERVDSPDQLLRVVLPAALINLWIELGDPPGTTEGQHRVELSNHAASELVAPLLGQPSKGMI